MRRFAALWIVEPPSSLRQANLVVTILAKRGAVMGIGVLSLALAGRMEKLSALPVAVSTDGGTAQSVLRRMHPHTWASFLLDQTDGNGSSTCTLCNVSDRDLSVHAASLMHQTGEVLLDLHLRAVDGDAGPRRSDTRPLRTSITDIGVSAVASMTAQQRLSTLPLEWGERIAGAGPQWFGLALSWRGAMQSFCRCFGMPPSAGWECIFAHPEWPSFAAMYPAVGWQLSLLALRRQVVLLRDMELLPCTFGVERDGTSGRSRGALFQRLECIGDHTLGSDGNGRLRTIFSNVDTTTIADSGWLECLRVAAESGNNMDELATELNLMRLARNVQEIGTSVKYGADLLECLMAELRVSLWSWEPAHPADGITRYPQLGGASVNARGTLSGLRQVVGVAEAVLHRILDLLNLNIVMRRHSAIVRVIVAARFDPSKVPSTRQAIPNPHTARQHAFLLQPRQRKVPPPPKRRAVMLPPPPALQPLCVERVHPTGVRPRTLVRGIEVMPPDPCLVEPLCSVPSPKPERSSYGEALRWHVDGRLQRQANDIRSA